MHFFTVPTGILDLIAKYPSMGGGKSMNTKRLLVLALLVALALALQGCAEEEPLKELVMGEIFRDDFDSDVLGEHWIVGPEPHHRRDDKWSLTAHSGFLTIATQDSDIHEASNHPVNFFLYEVPYDNFEVVTHIYVQPERDFEQAGLFLYYDMDNFARLARVHAFGSQAIEPALEMDGSYQQWIQDIENTAEIYLKMTKVDQQISYAFSIDGVEWVEVPSKVYVRWDKLYVVLYAISPVSGREIDALFDYVEVRELKWEIVE